MVTAANSPSALFRFDADQRIGGGHAVRSLALADDLADAGWRCTLVVGAETVDTIPSIRRSGHAVIAATQDPDPSVSAMTGNGITPDLIVFDHYGIDASVERAYRAAQHIAILDDLADRKHCADLLLDPSPSRTRQDYEELVPADCRLCLGPEHAIVRRQFRAHRAQAMARTLPNTSKHVVIAAGATDAGSLTATLLVATSEALPEASIDVVLGAHTPTRSQIEALVHKIGERVSLHVDVEDMAALMVHADLALGAAGSSVFERCVLGLPMIIAQTADNQAPIVEGFANRAAALVLDPSDLSDPGRLQATIQTLARDRDRRATMANAAARACDGKGTVRFRLALLDSICAHDGGAIRLRLAKADDVGTILDWQRHPDTRRFARNPVAPTADEHERWFETTCLDPDIVLAIVEHAGQPAGMLRLDPASNRTMEVSILTAPRKKRLGIATAALAQARRLVPGRTLVAEVLPGNGASQALFGNAGYVRGADGTYRSSGVEMANAR